MESGEDSATDIVGLQVITRKGRIGRIVQHDPSDELLEVKVEFEDDQVPVSDWLSSADIFAYRPDEPEAAAEEDFDGELYDFPEEEGAGDAHGFDEIPGGIAVDSGASDTVMSRKHLPGYVVKPSPGSQRGQRWGSASGHPIKNEGGVMYKFMLESGAVNKGKTQIGDVRRPLAAVSQLTKDARNIVFFSEGEDWIIPRSGPIADEILRLVKSIPAQEKIQMHAHKGTYRMRAWIVPETAPAKRPSRPFGRQEA